MFKIGQKVVYIGSGINQEHPTPKMGEIVTIHSKCPIYPDNWDITEYLFTNGIAQSFRQNNFRPLDETFAEGVLERIKEEIKEEQLIPIKHEQYN